MVFFYFLVVQGYRLLIQLAALCGNTKARKWIAGRRQWRQQLLQQWQPAKGQPVVWMHCASLGEYEQGRPVLETLRKNHPDARILLTFFSPSGYEVRKHAAAADFVMYLPLDGPAAARDFLKLVQPSLAIFVKYEFWYFLLRQLHNNNVPTLLISAIFRTNQPFFQWWGSMHRKMLRQLTHIFVQNETSAQLLGQLQLPPAVTIAGDTRFDRVLSVAAAWQPVAGVESWRRQGPLLVAGSTWPADEQLLQDWFAEARQQWQLVIAPHEPGPQHLAQLEQRFPGAMRLSQLKESVEPTDVLLVDSIGLLSRLYRYATICYVGGGFNKSGHHNILEAAVYGKPVVTGPNYQKFRESVELKQTGGSFAVEQGGSLAAVIQQFDIDIAGAAAATYVTQQGGATQRIVQWIYENRLLTRE